MALAKMAQGVKTIIRKARVNALRDWQLKNGLNDRDAAEAIGLSRNTFIKHRDAGKIPPRIIELALSALTREYE